MRVENVVTIQADVRTVYELAATVEHWPSYLPHYRWVKVLRDDGYRRVVEMAARRDAIPVWWCAEQIRRPDVPCITFRHVRGFTSGMAVEWRFARAGDGVRVCILHHYQLDWPFIGPLIAEWIVGRLFVENIAGKTLREIKRIAESIHGGGGTPHWSRKVVQTPTSPATGPTQRTLLVPIPRSGEATREAARSTKRPSGGNNTCIWTQTGVRFIQSLHPVPCGVDQARRHPIQVSGGIVTVGV